MTVVPLYRHPFVSRSDYKDRVLTEVEQMVTRLERTVGDARKALDELRRERCKEEGGPGAGAADQGDNRTEP